MSGNLDPVDPPRRLLMGAGPSTVPEEVLDASSQPTIGHLDSWFLELADETNTLLRQLFRTRNGATFPVSGTGSAGMETMLANFVEPRQRLVVGVCGAFGERIADAAGRLGIEVVRVDAPAGHPVSRSDLEVAMRDGADALALVHGETSTGVAQPLDGLSTLVRAHDALLLVDCVTSLGGYPLDVDSLGIDVAFSGSQKCLNCPPGLAPITISRRAERRLRTRTTPVPSWCFDVAAILAYWRPGGRTYHHTPPVNAIYGLHAGLRLVLDEGLDRRWHRHRAASGALIAGLEAIGATSLVPLEYRLWPLAAIKPPKEIDEANVRQQLLAERGIEISPGLGQLNGEIWRIGTMGVNASPHAVEAVVEAIVRAVEPGSAEVAIERVRETWLAELDEEPTAVMAGPTRFGG